MGFMDNFTSDSPVTVKQPDYYAMVKEAAKAELITNAVNAEVPGYYIQAMITGKKTDFLNTLDAEEEKTGFRTEYGIACLQRRTNKRPHMFSNHKSSFKC